ncbi:hypothetical protein NQZ68_037196 [Dissostichus eleginoides]|nr:hypothetical protein NQZ68_037196 [Dissostichus eleginoides]
MAAEENGGSGCRCKKIKTLLHEKQVSSPQQPSRREEESLNRFVSPLKLCSLPPKHPPVPPSCVLVCPVLQGLIAMQIVSVLSAEILRTSEYDSVKIMVKGDSTESKRGGWELCGPAKLICYPGSLASSSFTPFITCFQWPPPSRLGLEGQGSRAPAVAKVNVSSSAGGNWERTLGTSRLLSANRVLAG